MYIRLRDNFLLAHADDHEILAASSKILRCIAVGLGAELAFQWISASLSTTIFVQGSCTIGAQDREQTLSDLFKANANSLP
jgi:hypothetical protein